MSWVAEEHDLEWPFDRIGTSFSLDPEMTALLVVDIQAGDVVKDPDTEFGRQYPEILTYWNDRVAQRVIPNTRRLIDHFRENRMRVVYTRNGNVTPHGAELTDRLKLKMRAAKDRAPARHRGSPEYDIAEEICPTGDELVVDKLTSSAFHNTMLDHALRNMGIRDVVIAGILTDMCVLGTARVAAEVGYNALICEDACATLTQRAHDEALLMHARIFGRVSTTDHVISELSQANGVAAD